MDPRMIPQGGSQERPGDPTRLENPAGVYYHPDAGKFIETSSVKNPRNGDISYHEHEGKIQGDAFAQIGFRPATDEELREYRAKQAEREAEAKKKASAKTTSLSS